MDQGQPAHVASDDGDVRDLRRHAYHERVVGEIEVVRLGFPRETSSREHDPSTDASRQ